MQNLVNGLTSTGTGKENYHTYSGADNTISIEINQKIQKYNDIRLSLSGMKFSITRDNGYWSDLTEVALNKFFVKFVFEEEK